MVPISPEILSLRILHCLQVPLRVEPKEMRGKVSDLKATEINAVAQTNMEARNLRREPFCR